MPDRLWGRLLIAATLCLPVAACQATEVVSAPTELMRVDSNGDALIELAATAKLASKCPDTKILRLRSATEDFRRMYTQLLAAYLAYQPVRLEVDDGKCEHGNPGIVGVSIPMGK